MHLKLNWASKLFEEVVLCRSYVKKNLLRKKDKKKKLKKIKKKICKKAVQFNFSSFEEYLHKIFNGSHKEVVYKTQNSKLSICYQFKLI